VIYLASPYSDPDPAVREKRYLAACEATAGLLVAGLHVFSPIVHSHPLTAFGLPQGWEFWERIDRAHLDRCEQLVVLTIPGWDTSIGVKDEIRIAKEFGIPVSYLSPEFIGELPVRNPSL
jgi:hypothetical protein